MKLPRGVAAAGALDFDDVGTEVRQAQRRQRAGEELAEVEDEDPAQWELAHRAEPPAPAADDDCLVFAYSRSRSRSSARSPSAPPRMTCWRIMAPPVYWNSMYPL